MKRLSLTCCLVVMATAAMAETCVVEDPTGTPLNVRSTPNGPIRGALHNGALVEVLDTTSDTLGASWAYIVPREGGKRGWVYESYLRCSE